MFIKALPCFLWIIKPNKRLIKWTNKIELPWLVTGSNDDDDNDSLDEKSDHSYHRLTCVACWAISCILLSDSFWKPRFSLRKALFSFWIASECFFLMFCTSFSRRSISASWSFCNIWNDDFKSSTTKNYQLSHGTLFTNKGLWLYSCICFSLTAKMTIVEGLWRTHFSSLVVKATCRKDEAACDKICKVAKLCKCSNQMLCHVSIH